MKILYRPSLAILLLSTTLAKADYWQAKHEQDTQALALETETGLAFYWLSLME